MQEKESWMVIRRWFSHFPFLHLHFLCFLKLFNQFLFLFVFSLSYSTLSVQKQERKKEKKKKGRKEKPAGQPHANHHTRPHLPNPVINVRKGRIGEGEQKRTKWIKKD